LKRICASIPDPDPGSKTKTTRMRVLDVEPSHICCIPKDADNHFCSVLQLSKQQKPQNSEACHLDHRSMGQTQVPTKPICCDLNAETPKPPTYLFIHIQLQRATSRQKFSRRQFPDVSRRSYLQVFRGFPAACAAVRLRHQSCFASVRRCLGRVAKTRKRKKACRRIFFINLNLCTISWGCRMNHRYNPEDCATILRLRRQS